MRFLLVCLSILLIPASAVAGDANIAAEIENAMFGDHRSEAHQARNRYRHPVGTLTFFGLKDGLTVMEISPGGGWYTEILAPVLRDNGQYLVAGENEELLEKFNADPAIYDQVAVVPFSPPDSSNLGEAESVDMVLTFRNVHGWLGRGLAEDNFKEFSRVLKPGGVLGVVQHRADAGSDLEVVGPTGYIPEEVVIDLARQAGLYLEARSEVNANPADDHDHESGVWTLPPAVRLCQEIEDEAEKEACAQPWREIGESDRMTLRFRKPMD